MVLPGMSSNGAGVRLRIAGIPIRFDTWFFIIGVLFSARLGPAVVVLYLVLLGGSILVHELGHALVARTTGAEPEIVIHALGGLTSWLPPGEVSRGRRVAISLAGPAAGISLGLLFVLADRAGLGERNELARRAINLGIYINILYGLFNLLPILPLDGGQTLRDLLPGPPAKRERVAAIVSVVVGAGAIVAALRFDQPFAAIFVGFFIIGNLATLRGGRHRPASARVTGGPLPAALQEASRLLEAGEHAAAAHAAEAQAAIADRRGDYPATKDALELAALAWLEAGDAQAAKRLLLDLPPGSVNPCLEGRVLLATGQPELGMDRLTAGLAGAPDDKVWPYAAALVSAGAAGRLLTLASDPSWSPQRVLAAAMGAQAATGLGGAEVAGRLAELAGGRASPADVPAAAYIAARAWAISGNSERALLALRAAAADSRCAAAARNEPAFETIRGAEFDAILRAAG